MRMLGIDPGLTCTGWGIIEQPYTALIHLVMGKSEQAQAKAIMKDCKSSLMASWLCARTWPHSR